VNVATGARTFRRVLLVSVALGVVATAEARQLGNLLAPGPLSKAHATLSGAENCRKCHEPASKSMVTLCLSCHKPVAERIARNAGVHRDVKQSCGPCHKEHRGAAADLLGLDQKTFDHAAETGFALTGLHAPLARECAKCHKTRSYLGLSTTCSTCHQDPHKPTLGADCAKCHTVSVAFKQTRAQFDHSKTAFPLAGSHLRVDCAKCHVNKVYKGLKFALCADCHKSPHRQAFADPCATCHTPETWKTRKFDHARTAYALKGKHATLDCVKCHTKPPARAPLKFDRCSACHQDPHRGTFKQDCSACHTEAGFGRTSFDHGKSTKFQLTGKHAPPLGCAKCHKNAPPGGAVPARVVEFRGLSTACVSCHPDVHKAELGTTCDACHTPATFKLPNYKHQKSPAFFVGEHQAVPCVSCHIAAPPGAERRASAPISAWTFKGLTLACATCHRDVHLGQVGSACHTVDNPKFTPTTFVHTRSTFQLTGKHLSVECRKCHKSETGVFPAGQGTAVRLRGLATTCVTCHQDQHLGQLDRKCETCHTTAGFKLPAYKHAGRTGFFVARHATEKCASCHKVEDGAFPAGRGKTVRYKRSGTECLSCHADQHRGALGTACDTCHTPAAWLSINRGFHKVGVFPLEGRHLSVDCASCHLNGVIKGTPVRCADCHWARRQDDRYRTRLGENCESCHRPTSWTAVNWNHATMTGFALSPAHRALGCDGCHKTQTFTNESVFCVTCHDKDYRGAKQPNHVTAGFPTSCEACHLPSHTNWNQATFNHQASFQLVGVHASQTCAACHRNSVYRGTPRDCYGCHKADYDQSKNPGHAAAGFPITCDSCHRATDPNWHTNFNHGSVYPLQGVHATLSCSACHKNGVYRGTPRDCYGCHKTDYDQSKNPGHAAAGFPTTCETCHLASAPDWHASFNHNSVFQLVGVHATVACATCHRNNVYKGTPRNCYGCHKTDYDQSKNPNHAAAGFPTTCDACHSASAGDWHTSFNHNAVYPLLGRHLTAACTSCHQNNVYKGTPRDCYPCHQAQYNNTTNPKHSAAGFPTTCASCHNASDSSWTLGRFTHTWFPITSGRHAGITCSTCHINSSSYQVFSCLSGCHAKATTDSHHQGRSGYRYDSAACYSCHPTGRAG
jgi:hypothetical protein